MTSSSSSSSFCATNEEAEPHQHQHQLEDEAAATSDYFSQVEKSSSGEEGKADEENKGLGKEIFKKIFFLVMQLLL